MIIVTRDGSTESYSTSSPYALSEAGDEFREHYHWIHESGSILTQCDFLRLLSSDGRCFNYLMKLSVHLLTLLSRKYQHYHQNPRLLSHLINLFFQHSVNQLCNEGCERNSKFQDETATTRRSSRNHEKRQILESAYMTAKWEP